VCLRSLNRISTASTCPRAGNYETRKSEPCMKMMGVYMDLVYSSDGSIVSISLLDIN
jgi:hypothetical protein